MPVRLNREHIAMGNKPRKEGAAWLDSKEKRFYDVGLASCALIISAPVVVSAAIATAVRDRQAPFFHQPRLGRNGSYFQVHKIRTLQGVADHGGLGRGPSDDRATRLGAVLRKYALDELPQFWNVLRADMSIVGPRPINQGDYDAMRHQLDAADFESWERAYTSCRPGLISHNAIATRHDTAEMHATTDFQQRRADYDGNYVRNASRMADLRLCCGMLATALTVIQNKTDTI